MMNLLAHIIRLPRYMVMVMIRLYQFLLSPDHSFWAKKVNPYGYCRFYPSCSQYGYEVVRLRGVIVGIPKMLWRIVRCNPWNKGGEDLPK